MNFDKDWRFFCMEKIEMEVDDFLSYCVYKGLATKTIRSYDQTLKLFLQYLKDECNIKILIK